MKALHTLVMAVALSIILGGCMFINGISYSGLTPYIAAHGDKSVAIATYDQRPYVVSGNKGPQFVGLKRNLDGIPFNVSTPNNVPLADEMSTSVARAFEARGFHPSIVRVSYDKSRRAAQDLLQRRNAERMVMITLDEWKSDSYLNTGLEYDVKISVYDKNGTELAAASYKGDENIGKTPPPLAFQGMAEEWFSNPKIVAALH
ncbi:MAG: hypothetical protein LBQ32_05565 [Burkholderiaceae bacterium]|jgi:uncharacterized protein YxeA|nr:hypothetical protein [Burkholderiaceae bacterium]